MTNEDMTPITIAVSSRQSGKTKTLIDALLDRANERGIKVEIVEPQPVAVAALRMEIDHPSQGTIKRIADRAYSDGRASRDAELADARAGREIEQQMLRNVPATIRAAKAEAHREGYEAAICRIYPTADADPEIIDQFMASYETPNPYRHDGGQQ